MRIRSSTLKRHGIELTKLSGCLEVPGCGELVFATEEQLRAARGGIVRVYGAYWSARAEIGPNDTDEQVANKIRDAVRVAERAPRGVTASQKFPSKLLSRFTVSMPVGFDEIHAS